MALNLTAERDTPVGEGVEAPSPLLHILSSDGHLCSFSCVNTKPGAPELCAPAPELPEEGRRKGCVQYPEPTPAAAADPPPPSYAQSKPLDGDAKPSLAAVPFGSGIFNPGSLSFNQSTPVKPFGAEKDASAPSQLGSPFAASTPFAGFGKPKEPVPSPLAFGKPAAPTAVPTAAPTAAPAAAPAPTATPAAAPVPTMQEPDPANTAPAAAITAPDASVRKRLDRKIDDEFAEFDRKMSELRASVASFSIDIGSKVVIRFTIRYYQM